MEILHIALLLLVHASVLYVTVTGLRCHDCHTVDAVDAPKSACYKGTSTNMATCGFMESCVAVTGEVDTVPKANPNATPIRKVAALRRCVSTLAAVGIHGCVTDANPYLHFVNDAQTEYIFSNFHGTICLCQKDGCTQP